MLEKTKLAMRIVTNAYDEEIERLIRAAIADLSFADVDTNEYDLCPAEEMAVITYCRLNFGTPDDYDRLKRSYDEQKAQLQVRNHGKSRNC